MLVVYSPEGKEEKKHRIDAQECIARCGYTLTPPSNVVVAKVEEVEVVKAEEATSVPDVDVSKMTADEMREYLSSKGVEFHHLTGEPKLRTLVQKYLDSVVDNI